MLIALASLVHGMKSPPRETSSLSDRMKLARSRRPAPSSKSEQLPSREGNQAAADRSETAAVYEKTAMTSANLFSSPTTSTEEPESGNEIERGNSDASSAREQSSSGMMHDKFIRWKALPTAEKKALPIAEKKAFLTAEKMPFSTAETKVLTTKEPKSLITAEKKAVPLPNENKKPESTQSAPATSSTVVGRWNHRNIHNAIASKKQDEESTTSLADSQARKPESLISSASSEGSRWRNLHNLVQKEEGESSTKVEKVGEPKSSSETAGSSRWKHRNFHALVSKEDSLPVQAAAVSIATKELIPQEIASTTSELLPQEIAPATAKPSDSTSATSWNPRGNGRTEGKSPPAPVGKFVPQHPQHIRPRAANVAARRWNESVVASQSFSASDDKVFPPALQQNQVLSPRTNPSEKSPKAIPFSLGASRSFASPAVSLEGITPQKSPTIFASPQGQIAPIVSAQSWITSGNSFPQRPSTPTPEVQQQKSPEQAQNWTARSTTKNPGAVEDGENLSSPVSVTSSTPLTASPRSTDKNIRPGLRLAASPELTETKDVPADKPQSLVSGMKARFGEKPLSSQNKKPAPYIKWRGGPIDRVGASVTSSNRPKAAAGAAWSVQSNEDDTGAKSFKYTDSADKTGKQFFAAAPNRADWATAKKAPDQESRSGFRGGVVSETQRSPVFSRTHPSPRVHNFAGQISPTASTASSAAKEANSAKPATVRNFRSAVSETLKSKDSERGTRPRGGIIVEVQRSVEVARIPEEESKDPAEESGIGENNVWKSPRSARLRALAEASGKGPPSTDRYTTKVDQHGASCGALSVEEVNSQNVVMKTPERPDVSNKKADAWESPRSARLKTDSEVAQSEGLPSEQYRPNMDQHGTRVGEGVADEESCDGAIGTPVQTSVSDIKAKLWGSGRTEKLIVPSKQTPLPYKPKQTARIVSTDKPNVIGEDGATLRGHTQSTNNSLGGRFGGTVQQRPQTVRKFGSPPNSLPAKTPQNTPLTPQYQKLVRGSPDVSTPHGPMPPLRPGGRVLHEHDDDIISRVLPPKRDSTPSWVKQMPCIEGEQMESTLFPPIDTGEASGRNSDIMINEQELKHVSSVETSLNQVQVDRTMANQSSSPPNDVARLSTGDRDEQHCDASPLLPPRPSSRNEKLTISPQPSEDLAALPPSDLKLCRSPSIGDFQVATSQAVRSSMEMLSDESEEIEVLNLEASPSPQPVQRPLEIVPVSPILRPTSIPKWDRPSESSGPESHRRRSSPTGSPSRRFSPTKLPIFSPNTVEKRLCSGSDFSESIDFPPFDDFGSKEAVKTSDAPAVKEAAVEEAFKTLPSEFLVVSSPPVSPSAKQHPWNDDANTLSPNSCQKRSLPPNQNEAVPTSRPLRYAGHSDVDSGGEEKKNSDEFATQAQSPSSLMRMASDSIHAVDYEKAVERIPRRTFSEDDMSQPSAGMGCSAIPAEVPPEFENAISDGEVTSDKQKQHAPVFGDPKSFGAAGGEEVAVPSLKVADRAKAIASWNGGLGVSPKTDKMESAYIISPIRHQRSDNEDKGMSPRLAKRGIAIEDWKRDKSFDSNVQVSSDFWQHADLDNSNEDKDWPRGDHGLNDGLDSEVTAQAHIPPPKTRTLLEQSEADKKTRTLQFWRKQNKEPQPESTTSTAAIDPFFIESVAGFSAFSSNDFVFDPFGDTVVDKIEFTEATDFTEGTDFFAPSSDPFAVDAVVFSPKEFVPKHSEEEYLYHDEVSPPHLKFLAQPSGSGSHNEIWSYDADTSNLHEEAAEI